MRALAIALTLLAASPALADRDHWDRDRDNDPIVMNERRLRERLDEIERLLEKIAREKNRHERAKLVSKAQEQVERMRKMIARAPELDERPSIPPPHRPPAGQPQPPPPPVVVQPPPPPVVYPIADAALRDLLRAIRHEDFPRDRLRVLEQAAPANYFIVAQAQQVLSTFDFPRDRLQAMRLMKPRLLDPENFYRLYASFDFASDKAELKKILGQ